METLKKRKKKNWSVIILMTIGILFITIAGTIFVSNAWKLMTETAKEICLAAITIGIFIGSHFARQKDSLAITGKALYYLGVLTSGFSSYMILGFLNNILPYKEININCIRFALSIIIMMLAMVHIYSKTRVIFDIVVAYLMFGSSVIAGALGLDLTYDTVIIIFSIETLLLAINDGLICKNEDVKKSSKICASTLYIVSLFTQSLGLMGSNATHLIDDSDFGYLTTIAILLFSSTLVNFFIKKTPISRLIATFETIIMLISISADVRISLDIIPNYYQPEFSAILVVIFIVLTKLFWYDDEKTKSAFDIVTFIVACITGLSLLTHNVECEEIACVLTLGIISFGVLVVSSLLNEKKYQILSGVILGLMAIYLTRSFWLSIAWWIYLLFAGIVCIALAIVKEKNSIDSND